MSSENDTSINVCVLGNAKVGGLLGLGVQGVSLIFITNTSSVIVQFSQSLGPVHTAPIFLLV